MKAVIFALVLFCSFSTFAGSTYHCSGKQLGLVMVLNMFGESDPEVIVGNYKGLKFKYAPDENYRPTRDVRGNDSVGIEGVQSYSYYKDPKNNIVVRVSDSTLATVDDGTLYGYLFINGEKVSFDCYL